MPINITNLRAKSIDELVDQARYAGLDNAGNLRHADLIFELTRAKTERGELIIGDGILEILSDGFGFLRSPISEFAPGTDDIYVSPSQIRRFNLRTGDHIHGKARAPREGERYLALLQIHKVNGRSPEEERNRLFFDTLTPVSPYQKCGYRDHAVGKVLSHCLSMHFGERVLLHAPPRFDLTQLFLGLANSVDAEVVFLLLNTCPEDVNSIRNNWKGEVFCSSFGEGSARHLQIAEMALFRAKRLAEQQKNVVLVVNSLTELARAGRNSAEQQAKAGADSLGSQAACSLWSAARALQQGGSLTILGVVLTSLGGVDQRLMEDVQEKSTSDIVLSPELIQKRLFPPIDVHLSRSVHQEHSLENTGDVSEDLLSILGSS